jgi:hypothetical protein
LPPYACAAIRLNGADRVPSGIDDQRIVTKNRDIMRLSNSIEAMHSIRAIGVVDD